MGVVSWFWSWMFPPKPKTWVDTLSEFVHIPGRAPSLMSVTSSTTTSSSLMVWSSIPYYNHWNRGLQVVGFMSASTWYLTGWIGWLLLTPIRVVRRRYRPLPPPPRVTAWDYLYACTTFGHKLVLASPLSLVPVAMVGVYTLPLSLAVVTTTWTWLPWMWLAYNTYHRSRYILDSYRMVRSTTARVLDWIPSGGDSLRVSSSSRYARRTKGSVIEEIID